MVEDTPAVLQFMLQVLTQAGYDVLTALSLAEARAILEKRSDLDGLGLVIDIVLDDGSGMHFAQDVVRRHADFRVLLTSGFTDDVLLTHPDESERIWFLKKPFTKNALLAAVGTLCDPNARGGGPAAEI